MAPHRCHGVLTIPGSTTVQRQTHYGDVPVFQQLVHCIAPFIYW